MFLPQARERRNREASGRSNRSSLVTAFRLCRVSTIPGEGRGFQRRDREREDRAPSGPCSGSGHAPLRSPQHRESADCHRQGLPEISSPLSRSKHSARAPVPKVTNGVQTSRSGQITESWNSGRDFLGAGRGGDRPQRNGFPSPRPEELLVGTNESSHHSWDATSNGLEKYTRGGESYVLRRTRTATAARPTRATTAPNPGVDVGGTFAPSLPAVVDAVIAAVVAVTSFAVTLPALPSTAVEVDIAATPEPTESPAAWLLSDWVRVRVDGDGGESSHRSLGWRERRTEGVMVRSDLAGQYENTVHEPIAVTVGRYIREPGFLRGPPVIPANIPVAHHVRSIHGIPDSRPR